MWRYYGAGIDQWRDRVGLREFAEMACNLPEDSATLMAVNEGWMLRDHLAAALVDEQRIANWMQSEDGRKGRNRPKPIPRPGVGDDESKKKFGSAKMSLDQARKWAASRRAA